ncbi:MAG: VOC family protein [Pseudomonadota bacterium]
MVSFDPGLLGPGGSEGTGAWQGDALLGFENSDRPGESRIDGRAHSGVDQSPLEPEQTFLHLVPLDPEGQRAAPYRQDVEDLYWKIGVTLCDVDLAVDRLRIRDVEVSQPRQFQEIGYLCHLRDPEGYVIELLQHRFAWNHKPQPAAPGYALGGPAVLGQVTLRIRDPEASLRFYKQVLGLRLLSRQAVPEHGFTLYFLAATQERPPHEDLDAVSNREWLWQRPYTTLELQHIWGREARFGPYRQSGAGEPGFDGLDFMCPTLDPILKSLNSSEFEALSRDLIANEPLGTVTLCDPDGVKIRLTERGGE